RPETATGSRAKTPVTQSAPWPPVRQTALHDPVMPATIRQGLSHSQHRCAVPRRGASSRCPAITWYPTCHHHSQDALGTHLHLPLFSWALIVLISLILSAAICLVWRQFRNMLLLPVQIKRPYTVGEL